MFVLDAISLYRNSCIEEKRRASKGQVRPPGRTSVNSRKGRELKSDKGRGKEGSQKKGGDREKE